MSMNPELYTQVLKRMNVVQKSIKSMESVTMEELGTQKEYLTLLGQCWTIQSNEKEFKSGSFEPIARDFAFQFCPFQNVTQRELSNFKRDEGRDKDALLGVFTGWEKGEANEWNRVMIFTDGDECWNGPDRVVRV